LISDDKFQLIRTVLQDIFTCKNTILLELDEENVNLRQDLDLPTQSTYTKVEKYFTMADELINSSPKTKEKYPNQVHSDSNNGTFPILVSTSKNPIVQPPSLPKFNFKKSSQKVNKPKCVPENARLSAVRNLLPKHLKCAPLGFKYQCECESCDDYYTSKYSLNSHIENLSTCKLCHRVAMLLLWLPLPWKRTSQST
jgi:hypothetical protein